MSPGRGPRAALPSPAPEPSDPPASPPGSSPSHTMVRPYPLVYLLFLPLGTCFPLLDRREPTNNTGGLGAGECWADLATGPRPHSVWGSSRWLRASQPQALLVIARGLQTSGREHAGCRFRFGRQDEGSEATGFLPAAGEKASGPLRNLAEELNGYSRKKGGFSFRFGRR
ncbi:orexigenic neuropeptide QRFP [Pongo pygmaeus]|uniref:orexigenic neuropeptide QRFP n=1 Tax=Pongo pygmaeus TaxID=9600 RepID=UPI0023E13D03|nr:orexigenic neuropeptide QRFP [Pongo pygmaeus]